MKTLWEQQFGVTSYQVKDALEPVICLCYTSEPIRSQKIQLLHSPLITNCATYMTSHFNCCLVLCLCLPCLYIILCILSYVGSLKDQGPRLATAAVGNLTPATMLCPGNWKLCHFFPAPRNYTVFCDIDSLCYTENKYNTRSQLQLFCDNYIAISVSGPSEGGPQVAMISDTQQWIRDKVVITEKYFWIVINIFFCYKYFLLL